MTGPEYEIIDTTADIGVRVKGKTLEELFSNSALAMFDIISDIKRVEPKGEYRIDLETHDLGMLLVDFLNQLLFLRDTDNVLFGRISVESVEKNGDMYRLLATASGEEFDAKRHVVGKDVKAATHHMLAIDQKAGAATIIFDI